jgi:hypothetical protein
MSEVSSEDYKKRKKNAVLIGVVILMTSPFFAIATTFGAIIALVLGVFFILAGVFVEPTGDQS